MAMDFVFLGVDTWRIWYGIVGRILAPGLVAGCSNKGAC
jgi:hypothetical protein